MAYAPEALKWLAAQVEQAIPSAVLSGIVGDAAHGFGYHRAANEVPADDYSRVLPGDRNSDGIDVSAAAALDMSMSALDMKIVTGRIRTSWLDTTDQRLDYWREAIGTRDGINVLYMDLQTGEAGTADTSHLWHVHVGGLRINCNNMAAMKAMLSVITGESNATYLANGGTTATTSTTTTTATAGTEEDDMGASFGPYDIPLTPGSYTIPPVRQGLADPRDAWLNVCNDTGGTTYALRVWYSKGAGDKDWAPLNNKLVLTSGQRATIGLPAGAACLSIRRIPVTDGQPVYEGHLTWCLERGPVIK